MKPLDRALKLATGCNTQAAAYEELEAMLEYWYPDGHVLREDSKRVAEHLRAAVKDFRKAFHLIHKIIHEMNVSKAIHRYARHGVRPEEAFLIAPCFITNNLFNLGGAQLQLARTFEDELEGLYPGLFPSFIVEDEEDD